MKKMLGTSEVSSEPSSERDGGNFYACKELAKMALPDYPGTERGWLKLVEREQWSWREAHSRGGKAGIKRLYQPPQEMQALIEASQQAHSTATENGVRAVAHTAYQASASSWQGKMTEPWVPGAMADVAVRAMSAIRELPDIPQTLSGEQSAALVVRIFGLLMAATDGNQKALQAAAANPEALWGALALAWETTPKNP